MVNLLTLLIAQTAQPITVPPDNLFNQAGIRFTLSGKWLARTNTDGEPIASCVLTGERGRLSFTTSKLSTNREYDEVVRIRKDVRPNIKRDTICFKANGLEWSLYMRTLRHTKENGKIGPNTVIVASGLSRHVLVGAEGTILEVAGHPDVRDAISIIKTLVPVRQR